MLFDIGYPEIAYKLLTASEPHGFGRWYKQGATTLHEYFPDPSRSHSHPMFGAVVAVMYEYIIGIRQTEESAGYREVIISPELIDALTEVSGYITSPYGRISVSYTTENKVRNYTVEIPDGVTAHIKLPNLPECTVGGGIHAYTATI